jgi:aryl-alcohol dehydrogenase-like predicted oxidoreductase
MAMTLRRPGASGIEITPLALGSWRTFERMSFDDGVAVMRAARDARINFLDDARYDDETGTAPIPTGYSEVRFGELFRAAGWSRAETVVSNKLWWEFWPEQSAAAELDASLARMQFDYVDVIYANPPPDALDLDAFDLDTMVREVAGLVASGRARAWAIVNWEAGRLLAVSEAATRAGAPQPCGAQLPYSLVHRSWVEDAAMKRALDACGAPVVASFVLAGGVLSGKYDTEAASGRAAGALDDPHYARAAPVARDLGALARDVDATPAALAIAFALDNPNVAAVLFGATSPDQLRQNAAALEVAERLDESQWARLRAIGASPASG